MANWQLNQWVKGRQIRLFIGVTLTLTLFLVGVIALMSPQPQKKTSSAKAVDLTGIVDESFTEAAEEQVLTAQQTELDSLKVEVHKLTQTLKSMKDEHQSALKIQHQEFQSQLERLAEEQKNNVPENNTTHAMANVQNAELWHNPNQTDVAINSQPHRLGMSSPTPHIHTVSFRPKRRQITHHLSPSHYVPSNTSVRAVILGGADADASVNGQSKNNGVMLFKFLEEGTLPNGQHSRLRGCRVSANAYGDISSERAFATLYRLSCAHAGEPIIDREVTGWVFFNGKVGIKGQPLMRDNKVMAWAGVSGALSGIASAAQYAQSVQQFGAYGATSVVPSSQIAPYAAYGGAAKAADTLSQYYVKRAEQYHPVIQVGAGNVVTVVFKDGFYLEPDEHVLNSNHTKATSFHDSLALNDESDSTSMNFTVPPEVLGRIDSSNAQAQNQTGGLR